MVEIEIIVNKLIEHGGLEEFFKGRIYPSKEGVYNTYRDLGKLINNLDQVLDKPIDISDLHVFVERLSMVETRFYNLWQRYKKSYKRGADGISDLFLVSHVLVGIYKARLVEELQNTYPFEEKRNLLRNLGFIAKTSHVLSKKVKNCSLEQMLLEISVRYYDVAVENGMTNRAAYSCVGRANLDLGKITKNTDLFEKALTYYKKAMEESTSYEDRLYAATAIYHLYNSKKDYKYLVEFISLVRDFNERISGQCKRTVLGGFEYLMQQMADTLKRQEEPRIATLKEKLRNLYTAYKLVVIGRYENYLPKEIKFN